MLPHPDDVPVGPAQLTICIRVAATIRLKFLSPPASIGLWPRAVDRTRVPIAPVNEDDYSCRRENDVSAPSRTRQHLLINAVAQP